MLINYCIENKVERLYSPPYHPKANGAVEAAHKIIQKYINDYFYTLSEEEFCLDIAILDALHFHNYSKHSSTLFTPFELKDTNDIELINEAIKNMKKTVGSKINKRKGENLEINDKLLINDNIGVRNKNNEIYLLKNKKKGCYRIPALFVEYKGIKLKIKIMKNLLHILEAKKDYLINCDMVRLANDVAYNYYIFNE